MPVSPMNKPPLESLVNMDELFEIMDNNMELLKECLEDFLSDWPGLFEQIREAARGKDHQTLNRTAHKIKGILQYLSAPAAIAAAGALEIAGEQKDTGNMADKLSALETSCTDLKTAITDYLTS